MLKYQLFYSISLGFGEKMGLIFRGKYTNISVVVRLDTNMRKREMFFWGNV